MTDIDIAAGEVGSSGGERRRRGGGRKARAALRSGGADTKIQSFLTRQLEPFEIVSEEGLQLIERNADILLEQVGVDIRDKPSALGQ